jgi:hypothetical protein
MKQQQQQQQQQSLKREGMMDSSPRQTPEAELN